MKKKYYLALGLLATLASCSQDEVMEVNRSGDEITFDVVANKATRAADVFCNQNMPESFTVSAISGKQSYIKGDVIKYENGKWVNQNGTRYWPEAKVDFYAHVNGGTAYKWDCTGGTASAKFVDFSPATALASQVDLLYAVKTEQEKTQTPVTLNFRHALSQIVFQARNDSKNLYVEISGVSVNNAESKGTFTFPSVSTDENVEDHTGTTTDYPETAKGWGTWQLASGNPASYEAAFTAVAVKGDKQVYPLTTKSSTETPDNFTDNTMLLLPQSTTAWDNKTEALDDTKGSYLMVNCLIYNVEDGSGVKGEDDVLLWGEQGEDGTCTPKPLAIPADFAWEQGKKYIYTIVFGNGNGGYDPEDPDPNPDPVLVPISFEVEVDDFLQQSSQEIESGIEDPGDGGN